MNRDCTLRVDCLTPKRLIDRAVAQGARLSAVRLSGPRSLVIRCDAASARVVFGLCERFSIPVRMLRRGGGSALAAFVRRRRTLLIGLAVFLALCAVFLSRVWRIEAAFTGEAAGCGDAAALSAALSRAGIAPGVPKGGFDPGQLAQYLQGALGNCSYVGVRVRGVCLYVEAVPEVPAPPVYDVDAARDLVSDRDGIVVRAVARSGELCVKPGDAVRRGQLLIRGEEKRTKEETRPIAALGEVVVRAWCTGEAVLPLSAVVRRQTGRTSFEARLSGPYIDLPLTEGASFDFQTVETTRLPIGGLFVPLEIVRTVRRETRETYEEIYPAALKARLAALACADAAQKLCRRERRDYEMTDRWVNYAREGDAMRATAIIEIRADAAVTREVLQGG
ncbi:MAG: sporulation protein YqfD [Clostridia bacterium]|nr:sporulation protein YqfD [Clostridia bacterium]